MEDELKPGGSASAPHDLRQWRENMGYSIAEASVALGSQQRQYEAWEGGTKQVPKYIKLAMAALALGIKV